MSRAERLAELVAERELDLLIVGDLVTPGESGRDAIADVFWMTGFSGTSGICLVGPDERTFMTDFRYTERAEREVSAEFDRVTVDRQLVPSLAERLRGRVGYDDAHTSVRILRRLEEALPDGTELVAAAGVVEPLRRRKDAGELRTIVEAAKLADQVYAWLGEHGLQGRTERQVARAAEARMRELGAEPAFAPIVAAGENGAIGHHDAEEREIRAGELVVLDMGALLDGYCSDCTRTVATGEPGGEEREVYELVAGAQEAGLAAIRAGAGCRAADAAAREIIDAAGHGERFGHGLGHGVGIQVHEAPTLNKRSEQTLEEGDVVTVEPGVYLPRRFGVRIEDLVAVTAEGCTVLTHFDKELRPLG
jgi:Xaa-Pro aminopeptidase